MKNLDILFSFFKEINVKSIVAMFGISLIFVLIIYLLLIMVKSFQDRKAALRVRLPVIDGYGEDVFSEPQFKEPKQFIVELVDANEQVVQDSKPTDEKEFMTALAIEAKRCITSNDENNIQMPDIDN